MITDRIGRQEVLLPINHDHFNYRKKQIHLEQISPVEMSEVKKRQSKTACGYWYGTVFIAFKRTRSCIMTLEGRDACLTSKTENLTLLKTLMSTLFHKRKMIATTVSIFSEGFNGINFCLNTHPLGRQRNCSDQIRGE